MADATFNDLLAELKSVNKSIKDSSGESATGRAKEAEQAAAQTAIKDFFSCSKTNNQASNKQEFN